MPPDDDPEIQDENLVMVVLLIWLPALFANEFWQNVFWTKKGGCVNHHFFMSQLMSVNAVCVMGLEVNHIGLVDGVSGSTEQGGRKSNLENMRIPESH